MSLGAARLLRMAVSWWSAATWLSVSGSSGEPGEGLVSAARMSVMPARIKSLEEAIGMVTFVGNHVMVSQVRVARVSQIQTV